ncbi:MAG: translation initiation factor IF-2 [Myxococcales bacterium FL481]|nr:MAG: translation initiation factor IF-2 [Myxococcales bacterium FL481]
MAKIRVYELARELGKDNKALEKTIRGLGISIKNYMSTLTLEQADVVRSELGAKKPAPAPASAPVARAAVRRRRAAGPRPAEKEAALEAEAEAEASAAAPPPPPSPSAGVVTRRTPVTRRPATSPVRSDPQHAPDANSAAPASHPPAGPPSVSQYPTTAATPTGPAASPSSSEVSPPVAPDAAPAASPVQTRPPTPAQSSPDASAAAPARLEPTDRAGTPMTVPAPTATAARRPAAPRAAAAEPAGSTPPTQAPRRAPERTEARRPATRPVSTREVATAPSVGEPRQSPAKRPSTRAGASATQTRAAATSAERAPNAGAARGAAPAGPAVGSRIELPRGTRRLPGGMAERMRDRPARVEATPPSPAAPVVERPAAPAAVAEAPTATGTPQPAATSQAAAPAAAEAPADDGRRVLRNEAGVIVGTTPERSEPRILGFIPLEQRRARPQVIITEVGKNDSKGRATRRKQREERAQQQGRRRKTPVRKPGGRGERPVVARPAAEKSEAKRRVRVDEAIQVSDLAHAMGQKSAKIIRVLWGMGMRGITINHAIDAETAELVAAEFGYTIENVAFQEEQIVGGATESEGLDGELRAPVVTIMGHVDHGKTSLLDYVREANVASGEAGGITQHVGAYRVETKKGAVVFLDTPGHQAFSAMRARGAQATDIVVLVVAADDGVMPTTVEAIGHAKTAGVPMVVAVNKVDKPEANVGRVKQMLMEHGLVGEEFGGETIISEVSAKTGQGVDALLENLALQAEVLDLRAPDDGRAGGVVLEARVDKGRGPVASVLVQSGRLQRGDIVVANEFYGKIRAVISDTGVALKNAGPSTPVEILGLDGVPAAGDRFNVVESERDAKQLVTHRRDARRRKESVRKGPSVFERIQKKKTPVLNIVLRTDVQGSAEAMKETLEAMSVDKVRVEVIFAGVGAITENDVKRAKPADAVILGFNVKPAGKAGQLAESENVRIHSHSVIYEATDKVKELMIDLLEPEYREREQGEAEVRQLFAIPRLGVICGCRVTRGAVYRNSHVRVRRGDEIIFTGHISSLRRFKDDVREVKEGAECGVGVEGFTDAEPGDVIEAFELETLRPEL